MLDHPPDRAEPWAWDRAGPLDNAGGTTSCHITLSIDGSVTLVLGTVDLSATRTSLAMVAAEALGLELEDVRVVVGANVVEVPSSDHPYGIRAVGQVPIVPPAAALATAIYRAVGVRLDELPMTGERLYNAMRSVSSADAPGQCADTRAGRFLRRQG